jgi:hypothetical protein
MSIESDRRKEDYRQDVRSIRFARTFDGAARVARSMKARGTYDVRAESVLTARADYPRETKP